MNLGVDYINMNDGSALDKVVETSLGTAESTDKGKTIGYVGYILSVCSIICRTCCI